jgi:hypothetical protein
MGVKYSAEWWQKVARFHGAPSMGEDDVAIPVDDPTWKSKRRRLAPAGEPSPGRLPVAIGAAGKTGD